ncbi:MAG: TonB-dependent receptor [Hyphomonadaceae bacterium]|nr:TonB-dependent receptor [Hyphomonadaceae bacterium]
MRSKMSLRRLLMLGALSSVGSLCAGSAFAQEESPEDMIIVTATKRETDLQDTPIAISVLNASVMEDRHVQDLLDLTDGAIPSLRMSTFESRQSALTVGIRGIVPNDANQPAREQGVGVYLDGVYLGRQQGLNAAMLDLERVEVLKGPQGTLFGRNTEGGAVSMVTRRPTGEFELRAAAGIANFNGHSAEAHLDLPEVAGISIKLDGAVQYHDETTENPLDGATGWNYLNRNGFRAAALWEPVDGFSAQYAFDTGHSETTPFLSQLVVYNPLGLPVSTAFPRPSGTISPLAPNVHVHPERQDVADIGVPQQPSVDETLGHSLHVNWEITPDLELRSITAYREVTVEQWDNSGGPNRAPVFQPNAPADSSARNFSRYSLSDMEQLQRSQEFQLVGTAFDDRLDYVIGAYYFNEKAWEEAATPSTLRWIGSNGDYVVLDPRTFPGSEHGFRSIDRGSVAHSESSGIFVHTTYTPPILDDALHVTLGGRQTWDEKHGTLYRVANQARNYSFDLEESRFDPVATVAYDLSQDINVYGTYATGYRAGGANSRSLTYTPFASEEVESFELGLKAMLFDQLRMNVALFNMERTNSQIEFTLVAPDPVSGSNRNTVETVNAPGVTEIRGAELDLTWEATENLTFTFAYAYTDTNVPPALNPFPASPACPACGTVQPVYIIYTPFNTFNAAVDYTFPLGWAEVRAHLDANYADGTQSFEQSSLETDDSFIVNGRVALAGMDVGEGREMTFSLWSRNLLNEEHIYRRSDELRRGTNAIGDYANFNEPRMYGAEVSFRF